MFGFIKRNWEFIIIIFISIYVFVGLILNFEFIIGSYVNLSLNQHILNFSGTLFGLLLTAYAILFGLIPSMRKDFLRTSALEKINQSFIIAITLSIILVATSFLFHFVEYNVKTFIIIAQLEMLTILLLMSFSLMYFLYLLFRFIKAGQIS